MPYYFVTGRVTVSACTYVKADSPEEAVKLAEGREAMLYTGYSASADAWEMAVIEAADGDFSGPFSVDTTDERPDDEDEE